MPYSINLKVEVYEPSTKQTTEAVEVASAGLGEQLTPLPKVGDLIDVNHREIGGELRMRQVLSRRFVYSEEHCSIILTVKNIDRDSVTGRSYGVGHRS
jgi:hypothetical protein